MAHDSGVGIQQCWHNTVNQCCHKQEKTGCQHDVGIDPKKET